MSDLQFGRGHPYPLGATRQEGGVNFTLASEKASQVTLCLFMADSESPIAEVPLKPQDNKTGNVWHILVKDLPSERIEYGFKVDGPKDDPRNCFHPEQLVHDPYAKGVNSSAAWGHGLNGFPGRGKLILDNDFDWKGTKHPQIPMQDLVIYEMHVRSFTRHSSSGAKNPGTYAGVIEKIPYLKSIGVNAVELMPIFEFDETLNAAVNPQTHEKLKNYWGYSTVNFFTPMNRYASSPAWTGAIEEFRTLVRELHRNGIEVILDVVFNHTGETKVPAFSFKGIDNTMYYMVDEKGTYLDFTGTGNTVNANHPVCAKFIVDSLRYWVTEMGVDGFRFDLASSLTRDAKGTPLGSPPVIEAITHDPVLSRVKLIAEAWDIGLYQVGTFPGGTKWAEWNGKYRDTVRRFLKGTDNQAGDFAKMLCGSKEIFASRGLSPFHSINFVTAHDGFSLRDLVSYNGKHNLDNGENNNDGANDNESWNCGHEGASDDPHVKQLRDKQMRNFLAALLLSIGTPMVLMGDEYGHTRNGNNNVYCQDNKLNWFLWDELERHPDFFHFFQQLIKFRKDSALLKRTKFLSDEDVDWHGLAPLKPNWGSRFVAYTLKDHIHLNHLYVAFNAHFEAALVQLPDPPHGKKWYRVFDTSLSSPHNFPENPHSSPPLKGSYHMPEHSCFVAKAL